MNTRLSGLVLIALGAAIIIPASIASGEDGQRGPPDGVRDGVRDGIRGATTYGAAQDSVRVSYSRGWGTPRHARNRARPHYSRGWGGRSGHYRGHRSTYGHAKWQRNYRHHRPPPAHRQPHRPAHVESGVYFRIGTPHISVSVGAHH